MISPQGYQLGADPKNKNPFWDENGEDSSVNRIYATATVDDRTGVPGVVTSKSVSGNGITFNFDFHNLKGERGEAGVQGPAGPEGPAGAVGATGPKGDQGDRGPAGPEGPQGPAGNNGVSPTAKVEQTGDNEATITITDASGTTSAVLRGEAGPAGPEGPQGPKGDTGETGATGATGETGPEGPQGPAGPGVPAGGTAGQVLTKVDGTDYNTEWKDPAGGHVEWKANSQGGGIYPHSVHQDIVMRYARTGNLSNSRAKTYTVYDILSPSSYEVTVRWGWNYSANTKIGEADNINLTPDSAPIHSESFTSDNVLGFYAYSASINKAGVTVTIEVTSVEYTLTGFTLYFNINTSEGTSYSETESSMDYSTMNNNTMYSGTTFNVLSFVE